MIYPFLYLGLLILLALILRFVLPDLIYGLRREIVKVQWAKAFLDQKKGRVVPKERTRRLLMRDFRYESSDRSESYALYRINKIRELYFVIDSPSRQRLPFFRNRKHEICVIELAALLGNLARQARPTASDRQQTVDTVSLLTYIANHELPNDQKKTYKPSELEEWFHEHPISLQQVSEIVSAAVFCLAYRQQTQRRPPDEARSATNVRS